MQRRAAQLTIAFDPEWKRQNAWDVPIPGAELTKAFPATSRNYLDIEETIEDIMDCTGQDFLFELMTARVARLNIDFDVDPDILGGVTAFLYGVAAAPSGGTSEVQTETLTASGGTRTLTVQTGAIAHTTTALAHNANAAAIQAALEALPNVGAGDIVVSGTGPFTYTFSANLSSQDVNLITVNTFGLTGGTSTMVETTPGVGRLHAISRLLSYALPLMTLYIGFRDSDKQPVIFKNVVVNSLRVRSSAKGRVTASVQLIGSAVLDYAVGFSMPPCMDIVPIRFGDCQANIGGTDYILANMGRETEFFFENGVVPQFDGAGVDVTRLERADQRPNGFNLFILGEPGDPLYEIARAKTTLPVSVRYGPAGRHVLFTAPQGLVKLAPTRIRFGGDPSESEIAIVVRNKKISGDNTTPTNVSAVIAASQALLTSA